MKVLPVAPPLAFLLFATLLAAEVTEWGPLPFLNTGLLLVALGWGIRKLGKLSEDVKGLPNRAEFDRFKDSVRSDVTAIIISSEQRLSERLSRLDTRVAHNDERIDELYRQPPHDRRGR